MFTTMWRAILLALIFCLAASAEPALQRCVICAVQEGSGPEPVAATAEFGGKSYSFCRQECKDQFEKDPGGWAARFDALGKKEGPGDYGPLPDFDFGSIKRSDCQGKVLIVDFWATWCGPCVQEIPEFIELQKKHPEALRIVGISYDKEAEPHELFVKEKGLNYPSVLASAASTKPFLRALIKQHGPITAIPVTLLVNRQGQIIFWQVGPIDDAFKQALAKAL